MKKTVQQQCDLIMVKLDEAVEQTLLSPTGAIEYAADLGCTPAQVYLASARQNARAGRLFDAAVACVAALAYQLHQEEISSDTSTPSTPAVAGSSDAEAVDSGERT